MQSSRSGGATRVRLWTEQKIGLLLLLLAVIGFGCINEQTERWSNGESMKGGRGGGGIAAGHIIEVAEANGGDWRRENQPGPPGSTHT